MFEGKRGSCKVVFDDGSEYDGDIENGKRHGTGKFTSKYGDVYDGDWKVGKWDGKGKWVGTSGYVYEGEFKYGHIDGYGKVLCPSGSVYEGEFKNDVRDGTGKYSYHNGDVFEGQWKDNLFHGTGTKTYADGSTYTGEWKDGKKHGSGTFTDANGEKYKQLFNNGERVSNKRVATLINGPPSQRPRTAGGIARGVVFNDEHTECGICFSAFSSDMPSTDDDVRRHLPVLSTCGHCYCLGCVRDCQVAIGEGDDGLLPERIPCMKCRRADAFSPSQPTYDTRFIEWLEQSFPMVIEEHSD